MEDSIIESRYYDRLGSLFLYDVRFDPADRAHFNPLPAGGVALRLQTEHGFDEVVVVYNDGRARAQRLEPALRGERFLYWEGVVEPAGYDFTYSFALRYHDGQVAYVGASGLTHAVETPFVSRAADVVPFDTPRWVQGAVMYQIFPERLASGRPDLTPPDAAPWGAPPASWHFQGGDLWGIAEHLDHIAALGVDVLYLNPINASPSNHRYDATDFYHVDPLLGGDEALHALVSAVHERGMRIILDASFNHCHPGFFAFQDLLEKGPASAYRKWFTVYEYPLQVRLRQHLVPPERRERMGPWLDRVEKQVNVPFVRVSDSDGPAIEPTYSAWYDVLTMPQLNQRNPETRAYFLDVARHWLRAFDIDGWRMDVVQFVTPDFWPDFRRAVKETKPDAYLLSEVWGDTSLWLQGDQFDGTMNYSFRDLCLGFFARAEISTARLVEGLIRLYGLYAPQVLHANQNLLSSHDVARFRHLSGERPERVRLATFFQLTMPGVASIYYGDEIGMTGGDDPDNRRAFPWDRPETWDLAQLALTRDLARLRHEYPALRRGDWQPLDPQPGGDVHAFMRTHEEQRILVVLRREGPADPLELPVDGHQATIIYGDIRLGVADGVLRVENLAAWSGAVIAL